MWSFWDTIRVIGKMSFLIGEDGDGNLVFRKLNDIPHFLISGATGTGKSVFLHSFLSSLIIKNSPESMRFILYDSKMVELNRYTGEPHLFLPVMNNSERLKSVFGWIKKEIENRLSKFLEYGKRSLDGCNEALLQMGNPAFPHIVVVIDDISSVISEIPELFEEVQYVSLKGRTAGVHLVLAAQTTAGREMHKIAELIQSKLVFSVSTEKESTFLIGNKAAQQLGPYGNAIFSAFRSNAIKVKTIMMDDDDIQNVLAASKKVFSKYTIPPELLESLESNSRAYNYAKQLEPNDTLDSLLPAAVDVVFETGQASVSMLQRRLKLEYSRASQLVDIMEKLGIVGEFMGAIPRQILITKDQWEKRNR